jgi:MFS family permease
MILVSVAIAVFGLLFAPLFGKGDLSSIAVFMVIGLSLTGLTYGPLGTLLSEVYPPAVRYPGATHRFNPAGILGASLAPYLAMWLATSFGLRYVGYYLTAAALLSLGALLLTDKQPVHAAALQH